MRAVVIDGGVTVAERPDPVPAPGEALVRVVLAGICGTDLELARGYMGFRGVPGHEFVGVVERVEAEEGASGGTVRSRWIGRRVVGEINLPCRSCPACLKGHGRHCPARTVLGILGKDGAHAERLTLPVGNLHLVPDSVSDREAVFIEPLAAACEILDQVRISDSDRVLVVGDGRLGQLVARVLRTVARSVTVLGRHPSKLARLARFGIATVPLADAAALGRDHDLVVEASGAQGALETALDAVRPRGTLVLKSTYHASPSSDAKDANAAPARGEASPMPPMTRLVVDEITLVGSRCGRFEAAIPLLARRAVEVSDLVSETLPLTDALRAYGLAGAPGVLKVLLEP